MFDFIKLAIVIAALLVGIIVSWVVYVCGGMGLAVAIILTAICVIALALCVIVGFLFMAVQVMKDDDGED